MSKKTRGIVIAVAVLLVLVIGVLFVMSQNGKLANPGAKVIQVSVVHADESRKEFKIRTSTETLRAALEQENLVAGEESEYGLYVKTVDGETVDLDQQQWWAIYDGAGQLLPTGVDDTMIADGDAYVFILTTGW